ncbi:MmcQ/YjbR family DNA-binding protein [Allobranchiibius sp. CTAmp26]|nr:MmcQ/YjbR family DNA-binding protein [Allobranchiibius sp. CTAmp26]
MYDDADPLLHRLRELALAFPEAQEKVAHGRPTFFTTKVFAYYGGSIKGDHGSDLLGRALLFLPEDDERAALLGDERVHVPAYLGPSGWLALDLTAREPDWDEVRELLDASYRRTAPRSLVTRLDG